MFNSWQLNQSSVKLWQYLHFGNEYITYDHTLQMPLLNLLIDFAPFLWQGCVIFKFLHSSWLQVELGRGECNFLWEFWYEKKLIIYIYNRLGSKSVFQLGIPNVGCDFIFSSRFGCRLTKLNVLINLNLKIKKKLMTWRRKKETVLD